MLSAASGKAQEVGKSKNGSQVPQQDVKKPGSWQGFGPICIFSDKKLTLQLNVLNLSQYFCSHCDRDMRLICSVYA